MNKFNFCKVNCPADLLEMNIQNTIVTINYLLFVTSGTFELNKEQLQSDNRFSEEDKIINTGVWLRPLLFSRKNEAKDEYISYLNIPIDKFNKYLNEFTIDNCIIETYYKSENNQEDIISSNSNFEYSFWLPIQSKILMTAVNSAYSFKQTVLFYNLYNSNVTSILKKYLFNT